MRKFSIVMVCALLMNLHNSAHATMSILLKDPASGDYGAAMITSGSLSGVFGGYISPLTIMPAKKNTGVIGWLGHPAFFKKETSAKVLKMLERGLSSSEIELYINKVDSAHECIYAINFMGKNGTVGSATPNCPTTSSNTFVDQSRGIVITAGGQEPDVIPKTFLRLQELQDKRLQDYNRGKKIPHFACYIIDTLSISQLYGAEKAPLYGAGITLDLSDKDEIVSEYYEKYSSAASESIIVPGLKATLNTNSNIQCN